MSFQTSALLVTWAVLLLLALVVAGLVRQVHALGRGVPQAAALGPAPGSPAPASGYSILGYYDIYPRCPSYAGNHNCSPGCGPSVVCSSCCRTSGSYKGFHKSGVSHPGKYKLRPNQCYGGGYDGWIWAYAHRCGSCSRGVKWRCHDRW